MDEPWIEFLLTLLGVMSGLFIFAIGVGVLAVIGMYIVDKTQTRQAIPRNFPVIGRFRYLFEHLGEFFRQYFFAMDREEMPFNRAQRSWVYRAAKDLDSTVPFGSTREMWKPGGIIFANSLFPVLDEDAQLPSEVIVGSGCKTPYRSRSLLNISAMSFGAISKPAVSALSLGAHKAGCWINTGEGGLSPYHLEGGADIVFQIGTAKNGVRDFEGNLNDEKLRQVAEINQVRMFEIKLSQGAKPGKGGILPGAKVNEEIAAIRGIRPGQDAISPNRHREIQSTEDLLDLIERVRTVTGKPTGIKLCLGGRYWLDELVATIQARQGAGAPDFITLDGGDGGTGAAPMALIDDAGLPLKESLPLLVDTLRVAGLKENIRVIASGKLVTPSDVAWAYCMGADFVVTARGFMFSLGCIQALQCNKNTCPTGITTHDIRLQRGLVPQDKAERVMHYQKNMEKEVSVIAHSCGVAEPRLLRRHHVRMVLDMAHSTPYSELFPENR